MVSRMVEETFWQQLKREGQAVAVHAAVVLLLMASLLAIGTMARVLEGTFSNHKPQIEIIALVDVWTSLGLLSMFATYTMVMVGATLVVGVMRGVRGVRDEWQRRTEANEVVE
jgi:hypothetical protein